jgi:hypothetical protein
MKNKIRTSKEVATKAAKQLRDPKVPDEQKSVAASTLRNRAKK